MLGLHGQKVSYVGVKWKQSQLYWVYSAAFLGLHGTTVSYAWVTRQTKAFMIGIHVKQIRYFRFTRQTSQLCHGYTVSQFGVTPQQKSVMLGVHGKTTRYSAFKAEKAIFGMQGKKVSHTEPTRFRQFRVTLWVSVIDLHE